MQVPDDKLTLDPAATLEPEVRRPDSTQPPPSEVE
jgi:hypothetical protein